MRHTGHSVVAVVWSEPGGVVDPGLQSIGLVALAEFSSNFDEVACRVQGVGVIVAQDAATPGEDVFEELACRLSFAWLPQGDGLV